MPNSMNRLSGPSPFLTADVTLLGLFATSSTAFAGAVARPADGAATIRFAQAVEPGEDRAWSEAQKLGTIAGYISFLERFPAGRYASEARESQRRLEQQQG